MKLGIVGLANSGKSTLFNILTNANSPVAPYPFTTINPYEGAFFIYDETFDRIVSSINPKAARKAFIGVVDIAGLIKNAHKGEGLGNMFLSHIRAVDGMIVVLRGFKDENIPSPNGEVNPQNDFEILMTELKCADIEHLERLMKKKDVDRVKVKETLEKLEGGIYPVESEFDILLSKKFFVVLNGGGDIEYFRKMNISCIEADLKLEYEIVLNNDYSLYEELGLEPFAKRFTKTIKEVFGIVFFYTIKNNELTSFIIKKNSNYMECARKIHTDMAEGFIKALTVPVETFLSNPSWERLKDTGVIKFKGKEDSITEDEVIEIYFSKL